jgi:cytochrome c biogenesis protein CcmG, thiol:disulfide interchange protein DsbE
MRRSWAMLLIIAILTGLAYYQHANRNENGALETAAREEASPKKGYRAPSFELPNLDDQAVAVGGSAGQLTMINFWASWCGPCVMEAPDLQELHERYGDRLLLLGVNATRYDREREARQFVEDYDLTFPILMDREGQVTELYKVAQFPTTLLVDQQGVVRERITGVIPKVKWEAIIDRWM